MKIFENIIIGFAIALFCAAMFIGAADYDGNSILFLVGKLALFVVLILAAALLFYFANVVKSSRESDEEYHKYVEYRRSQRNAK